MKILRTARLGSNFTSSYKKLCNVWLSMMSGYGANPIFFNQKNKRRPEHLLQLHPATFNNISLLS